jgi:hypothetical protein
MPYDEINKQMRPVPSFYSPSPPNRYLLMMRVTFLQCVPRDGDQDDDGRSLIVVLSWLICSRWWGGNSGRHEAQDLKYTRKAGRYDEGRLPHGFKRWKTDLLSGQPILMVERLGGVRRAARVKPNLRHGEFFCSTRDEIFCSFPQPANSHE